ncbi:MAG: hypothetical protein F9K40_10940 [Kofleriaceae bacterium]|nr:MAG: hypothetical protein F9K40_10940 [Kofleriaceae bacterium]MBZ0236066.1 hypothetical protein [Kofleriaceae bacterium]
MQRPGVEGLVAFLTPDGVYESSTGGCVPTRDERARIMTPGYREIGALRFQLEWLRRVWDPTTTGARREVTARVLYADDVDVPVYLRRSRPAFPVGSQPMVATINGEWLPAVWIFQGRWYCLLGIDHRIASDLQGACRTAYLASTHGRCLDFTGALAAAVLAEDQVARRRLCTLLVEHGCGSVPAEAPPPTEPLP